MSLSFSIDLTPSTIKAEIGRIPAWGWLVLVAAGLRFVNLGQEALWYDEAYTAWLAKLDLPSMFRAIQGDVHPPLWYLIEWVNIRLLGSSEFVMRLPDAIIGVLCVLLVWRLAQLLDFDRTTAFIAGLLVAIMPAAIYYSQDARMYPLMCFFLLWAAISAIKGKWWYFRLAAIGAIYTQHLSVFYIVALAAVSLYVYRGSRQTIWQIILSGPVVVLALLPWLPSLLTQMSYVHSRFWIPPLDLSVALLPIAEMTVGTRAGDGLITHLYAAAFGITFIGLIVSRKWLLTPKGLLFLAFTVGGPALLALVSVFWKPIYLSRAVLPAMMAMLLVWAYALQHLSSGNRRALQLLAVPMLIVALISHYVPDPLIARYDARSPMELVRSKFQAKDVLYYVEAESAVVFQYYSGLPYRLMPEEGDLAQSLTNDTKAAMGLQMEDFSNLKALGYTRAWVVASTNPLSSAAELNEVAYIKSHYRYQIVHEDQRPTAQIYIYLVTL